MKYKLNFSTSATSDYYRRLQTSVLLLFIVCLSFVFVPYLIVNANAAESVDLETTWGKITLELQTGDGGDGDVEFNGGLPVVPDEAGVVATQAKTLTVNTTGKHFRVYLSMDSSVGANRKLCYDFDATDDAKKNCTHTTIGISPVTENAGSPAALTGNSWGYALNDGETGFSTAGTYFNDSLSGEVITSTTGNAADAALYSAKFAAVPVSTAPVKIWSADTNNNNGFGTNSGITGDINNTKEIVYGVKVNSELVAGTYGSKILYTAMASASDFDTPSMNVASSKDLGGPTDVTTLYMDLNTEGISLSASDLTIRLVSHANAKTADGGASGDGKFTASELATAVASAAGTCASVSNLVVTTGGIKVDCTLPDLGVAADGVDYDFIVSVPVVAGGSDALTTNYVSYKKTGTDTGAFRYVGLQTKNGNNPYVTTMQGMTTGICKMTNQWGTGTGVNAQLYDRYGEDGDGTNAAVAIGTAGVGTTSGYGNYIGTGTFALTDSRDNKQYLVRRLADGNCWMVQNLDLELSDFIGKDENSDGLTPSNTDISYGLSSDDAGYRASWDPSASFKSNTYGTFSTFSDWSDSVVGMSQPRQFQAWNELGNKGVSGNTVDYSWGSAKAENGTTLASGENVHDSVYVANNRRSQIPRSYSNTVGTQYRYIPTNPTTGARTGYTQQTTGSATDNPLAMTSGFTPTATASSGTGSGNYYGNMYVGNYYNWYAATAESGVYNSTSTLTVEGSAKDSICPKGWQLPINGPDLAVDSGSFLDKSWVNLIKGSYDLINVYGTQTTSNNRFNSATEPANRMQEVPLSIILSGNYSWVKGAADNRGYYGYYWASTPSYTTDARGLTFHSTYVGPQSGGLKVYGFTVRCVAR